MDRIKLVVLLLDPVLAALDNKQRQEIPAILYLVAILVLTLNLLPPSNLQKMKIRSHLTVNRTYLEQAPIKVKLILSLHLRTKVLALHRLIPQEIYLTIQTQHKELEVALD